MDEALELEDIDAAYCLLFLREVRDAAFATVDEEGLPAVRVIDVMMVEDGRLYFVAARGKAFCADIMRTRYVAIVGQSRISAPAGCAGRWSVPTTRPNGIA